MFEPNARAARTALLVSSFLYTTATAQVQLEPLPFTSGISVVGVLDYDGDGVDELLGIPLGSDRLIAAVVNANGEIESKAELAGGATETDNFQLADIDGDGQLDLLGMRRDASTVDEIIVFYGRANPGFEDPVSLGVIPQGRRLVTSDVDGDGDIDLLFYPASQNLEPEVQPTVEFLLRRNNGGGSFISGAGQTFSELLRGAVPIPLDQDGDQDFVAIDGTTSTLVIVRSVGGVLELSPISGSPSGYLDLAVGDVNDDSFPDVAAFRRSAFGAPANVDLFLGNAAGSLDAPVQVLVDAPGLVADIHFGDFNGDLNLDLSITTSGSVQTVHRIQILAGDGQGTLTPGVPSSNGEGRARTRCVIGDINGDGRDDVVNRSFAQGDQGSPGREVRLARLGQAAGGFFDLGQATDTMPEPFSADGSTGDLDGDGVLDILGDNGMFLVWRKGSADSNEFGPPLPLFVAGEILAVADFDSDGVDEVLILRSGLDDLRIIDSLGGGLFGPLVTPNLALETEFATIRTADFDGDGDIDILAHAPTDPSVAWHSNLAGFQFAAPEYLGPDPTLSVRPSFDLGDFNGDGRTDILIRRFVPLFSISLTWYEGLGGGALGAPQSVGDAAIGVKVFDLDQDGIDDAVWSNEPIGGSLVWSRGSSAGLLPTSTNPLLVSPGEQVPLGAVDFDGDGLHDLITFPSSGRVFGYRRLTAAPIAFDQTAQELTQQLGVQSGRATSKLPALVDFGADGDLDLLAGSRDLAAWFKNTQRGPVGETFCGPGVLNSTGHPSRISGVGTSSVSANSLTLRAADLPSNAFGFFIVSQASQPATSVPASSGRLCLDGAIGRYVGPGQVGSSGASGTFALGLDLTAIPQPLGFVAAQAGSTWFFQAWHRDSAPTGPTSNFTDGLMVTFE